MLIFLFLVSCSCLLFLVYRFSFLLARFLVSCFLFLVSFSVLISRFLFRVSRSRSVFCVLCYCYCSGPIACGLLLCFVCLWFVFVFVCVGGLFGFAVVLCHVSLSVSFSLSARCVLLC